MRTTLVIFVAASVLEVLTACAQAIPTPTLPRSPSPSHGSSDPPLYNDGPVFILLDASLEGGTLKVFVDLNREKEPQWFDDPLLLTGTEPLKGAMSGGRAPYAIVFEGVSGDLRESMIEFPKVTVKIDKTTTQSASATTLQGPEGELLTVTGRETTPNGFIIHYAPPTQYGPMVAKAVICAGDRRIRSSGSGGTFSPDPQKSEGSIVFPSEARSLSDAEGAMIEVESFFRVVRVLVPVVLATDGK